MLSRHPQLLMRDIDLPFTFSCGLRETLHPWCMHVYVQVDMLCERLMIHLEQKHSWLDSPQRGSSHRSHWSDRALQQRQRNNVVVSQNRISLATHFWVQCIKKKTLFLVSAPSMCALKSFIAQPVVHSNHFKSHESSLKPKPTFSSRVVHAFWRAADINFFVEVRLVV